MPNVNNHDAVVRPRLEGPSRSVSPAIPITNHAGGDMTQDAKRHHSSIILLPAALGGVWWMQAKIIAIALLGLFLYASGPAIAQSSTNNGLIALTLKDRAGRLQIFTIHPDGTAERQLTFSDDNGRPAWSPDGRQIVYSSMRGNDVFVNIMNADGSNSRTLCQGEAPDWSPDGRKIAFSWQWSIWTIDPDGRNRQRIAGSATAKRGPSWSPDSRQIAFILIRHPMSPHDLKPQVGIMMADGSGERVLTQGHRMNVRIGPDGARTMEPAEDANAPAWSPVSDEIAFWSGKEERGGDIWIIRADGSGARQLTAAQPSDDPSWSPDGREILFSTGRNGRNELWVMDKDGRNQRKLHDIAAFPFPGRAAWQPRNQ